MPAVAANAASTGFNMTNAQSVTLKVAAKVADCLGRDRFVLIA